MYRVFAYYGTANVGDAIQTFALCRLLGGPTIGVYRDHLEERKFAPPTLVANGWMSHNPPACDSNTVFAGVHVGQCESEFVRWAREAGSVVGCRDPFTEGRLRMLGAPGEMIGCATLTLPRYRGIRRGRYTIDSAEEAGFEGLTNRIHPNLPWEDQWALAARRLEVIQKAEVVRTTRLHIALPCLAFGTPLVIPSAGLANVFDKQRLTLLSVLGVEYDEVVELDVSAQSERFRAFVSRALNCNLTECEYPSMPITPSEAV